MREILSLPSSDYDFERISRKDRVCWVLDKKTQDPVLEMSGTVPYRIWLCLKMQDLAVPENKYYRFCDESNCFGTAFFLEGQGLKDYAEHMDCILYKYKLLFINSDDLNDEMRYFREYQKAFKEGRERQLLSEMSRPGTVFLKNSNSGWTHAVTFLGETKEGDPVFFDKRGHDFNLPFRFIKRDKISQEEGFVRDIEL